MATEQKKCCQQDPQGSQLLRKVLLAESLHLDWALFLDSSCPSSCAEMCGHCPSCNLYFLFQRLQ